MIELEEGEREREGGGGREIARQRKAVRHGEIYWRKRIK